MGYFKPLRRKVGVVTLVIACGFTIAWVRSLIVHDGLVFATGPTTGQLVASCHSHIIWEGFSGDPLLIATLPESYTVQVSPDERPFDLEAVGWTRTFQFCGFGMYEFGDGIHMAWMLHYWPIVCPQILLSIWLLLSETKVKNSEATSIQLGPTHFNVGTQE